MADKVLGYAVREGTIRDVIQVVVGSFIGALVFIESNELRTISDNIPSVNLCLIVITSVCFSYAISYLISARRLEVKKRDILQGLVPQWTLIQYLSSVFFSLVLFYMFGINNITTPAIIVVKRTLVLAMPSTITASAARAQKEDIF